MNAGEKVRDAEAWFSERSIADSLNPRYLTHDALKHAMTIVRAWLARDVPAEDRIPTAAEIVDEIERARDVPAPAGRDLTAQDIRDSYLLLMEQGAPENENRQFVADYLSRIARPSGGVGQPVSGTGEQDACERCAHRVKPGCPDCCPADRSPRSWSLPAPPPDDVTVVHADWLRVVRDDGLWWCEQEQAHYEWYELLALGDVVEGEPPAPEPQAAEPQAAEPPRFERGFYRLARDLDPDNGYEIVPAGLVFVSRVDEDGTAFVNTAGVSTRTTVAALAAAGAERVEER